MKNNTILRQYDGRILGKISEFNFNEDELDNWIDYKEFNVVFPRYGKDFNGECITYNISELKKNK